MQSKLINNMPKKNIKYTFGITSLCDNGSHIFMLDCDHNYFYEGLIYYLCKLQKRYKMNTIYIIKSLKGYNCFSLDKIHIDLIYKIGSLIPNIDKMFLEIGKRDDIYTLRIGIDKKFICSITPNKMGVWVQSSAHRDFFRNVLNYPIDDFGVWDNSSKIRIVKYISKKHGWYNDK